MFHPSISQEEHEQNIRRYNLALRAIADREQRSPAEVQEFVMSTAADIPETALEWIWPERLPVGTLSLIAGETGVGKSLVAADLAARVSSGRGWAEEPGETAPGDVLILSPRIDWEHLLRPRLVAAGADISRIMLFSDIIERRGLSGTPFHVRFDLRSGQKLVESVLDDMHEPRLVVIDSFSAFLSFIPPLRGLEHKELRGLLDRLRETAADRGLAVVGTDTFPGGVLFDRCRNARHMAAGLDASFQSVWGIVRDREEKAERLFLPIRNHLGNDREGLRFRVEPAAGSAAVVEWGAPEETLSFTDAMRAIAATQTHLLHSKTAWARQWVRGFLKEGPRPSKEILEAASAAGLTKHPVGSALREIGLKHKQGKYGPWMWQLRENGQNFPD